MFKLSKSPTLSSLAANAAGSVTSSRSGATSGDSLAHPSASRMA